MLINLKQGEYLGRNLHFAENSFFKLSMTAYEPNSRLENHYHENNYISILTKGDYLEKNSISNDLVSCGDILFRPNAYIHENLFESYGGTCFNIELKSNWQKSFAINLKLPDKPINYKTGLFPCLYKLLINFQKDYNEDLAFEFICDWLFQINQNNTIKTSHPWIEKVSKILENEFDTFHSLDSLSNRVFVHPVYLARAFKERKGITVGEYQLKMKLSNAMSLLLNTTLPVSDISHKNGFYDDAHFIRSFKSAYLLSPHKFRRVVKS